GARGLVGFGGLVGERVKAAMHIGVLAAHRCRHRLNDGFGLLSACGVVEIDERRTVDRARQDRKLRADGADIERALELFGILGSVHDGAPPSQVRMRETISSRTSGGAQPGTVSLRNAPISRARASSSGRPRERM